MPVPVTSRYRGIGAHDARGADGVVRATLPARFVPAQAAGATPYFHTVVAGETLESLAHRFLGSSEAWWQLADANPGAYPLALQPGSRLVIPTVADPGLVLRTRSF